MRSSLYSPVGNTVRNDAPSLLPPPPCPRLSLKRSPTPAELVRRSAVRVPAASLTRGTDSVEAASLTRPQGAGVCGFEQLVVVG